MHPFFSPACVRRLVASGAFLACCLLLVATSPLLAQSTFGSIQGTVRDASGALIQGAKVTVFAKDERVGPVGVQKQA